VVFPAEEQDRLAQELSKAEVVDFILYFLHSLHHKYAEKTKKSLSAEGGGVGGRGWGASVVQIFSYR